jgi:hypothetical protein
MTTLNEIIEIIKAETPTLQIGDEEQGYTQLSSADYEAQVAQWAENRLAKEAKIAAEEAEAGGGGDTAAGVSKEDEVSKKTNDDTTAVEDEENQTAAVAVKEEMSPVERLQMAREQLVTMAQQRTSLRRQYGGKFVFLSTPL